MPGIVGPDILGFICGITGIIKWYKWYTGAVEMGRKDPRNRVLGRGGWAAVHERKVVSAAYLMLLKLCKEV